jgi:hypothetical protein
LVLWDVFAERRLRRKISDERPPTDLTLTVVKDLEVSYAIEGEKPSIPKRVEDLEQMVVALSADRAKLAQQYNELQDYVNRLISYVWKSVEARERRFGGFLRDALGPFWRRLSGVILLFIGALLTAAATVASAACG